MAVLGVIRILRTTATGGTVTSIVEMVAEMEGGSIVARAGPSGFGEEVATTTWAETIADSMKWAIAAAYEQTLPKGKALANVTDDNGSLVVGRVVSADIVTAAVDPCGYTTSGIGTQRARARALADALMRLGNVQAILNENELFTEDYAYDLAAAEISIAISSALAPKEYQPVSLQVDEDKSEMFVEPGISATFYDCVKLRIGSQWAVSDFFSGKLYHCYVKSKNRASEGLISYTFVTLMTLLNHTEPPTLIITAEDADLGAEATPQKALEYILAQWTKVLPQLSWLEIPPLLIRTTDGTVEPTVPVIHIVQIEGQRRSMREWLESMFGVFKGYAYRMNGWTLQVTAPAWAVTPTSKTVTDADLLTLSVSEDDSSIINTQKVIYRPWEFLGDFEDCESLQPVTEPVLYRQGFTEWLPPPDDRSQLKNGQPAPWLRDIVPSKDKVLVTWTAYVCISLIEGPAHTGAESSLDVSEYILKQVHEFEMTAVGHYDAVTKFFFANPDASAHDFTWVWRLQMAAGGVRARMIQPEGNPTFEYTEVPGTFKIGAEFHLNVRGVTWQQSPITRSATYGVHVPDIGIGAPEGFEPTEDVLYGQRPPKIADYQADALVQASYEPYGVRTGPELVIEVWTLTLPTERDLVGEPVIDWNSDYEADMIAALGGIAETIVKNRINPSKVYLLELAVPFALSPDDIATRVVLPEEGLGDLEKFRYDPAFTPSASLAWWLDRQFASINRTQRNPDVEGDLASDDMYQKRVPKNEVHYLIGQLPGAPDKRITDRLRDMLNTMLENLRSEWTLIPGGLKSTHYAEFENAQNWVHGGGYYHLQYFNPKDMSFYGTDAHVLEERLAHDPLAAITAVMGINADQDPTYMDAFKRGAAYLIDHWEPKWEKRLSRDEWSVLKFRHATTHGVAGELVIETALAVIKGLLGIGNTVNAAARDRLAFRLVSDLEHVTAPNGEQCSVWSHICRPYATEANKAGGTGPHKFVYLFEHFGSVHMAHEFGVAGFDLTQMQRYANNISQLMYSATNENRIKGDCAGSGFFANGSAVPDTLANNVYPDNTLDSHIRRVAGGNVAWADPTTDKQNLKVMLREMERVSYTLERLEAYPSQAVWGFIEMGTLAASKGIDLRDL